MVSNKLRFRFTLVSYNILSQTLLNDHNYLYSACNPHDLDWPRRGHKIVHELVKNQADIICLQEVESEHLRSLYRPKLALQGYECLYKKKTGYKVDGCAIFYKSKLFHLLNYKGIEFNRTDIAHLLDRDNVGIIAVLQPRIKSQSESSHLIIANTHLIFNPRRSDIKLAQLKFFLSELESISQQSYPIASQHHQTPSVTTSRSESSQQQQQQYSTILCGDLNSTPDSEVIRYLLRTNTTKIRTTAERREMDKTIDDNDYDDVEVDEESNRNERNAATERNDENNTVKLTKGKAAATATTTTTNSDSAFASMDMDDDDDSVDVNRISNRNELRDYKNSIKFKSVFPTHNRAGQKYVSTFSSDIVDYIFYTPRLRLEVCRELLTEDQLASIGPLPNRDHPSDHIPLRAKFTLK